MKKAGKIRFLLENAYLQYTDGKEVAAQIEQMKKDLLYDEKTRLYMEYGRCLSECPIERRTILYEAFSGRGMICNPYAIFRYLLSQKKYNCYTHVWVIDDFEDNAAVMAEYADFPNVKFISYMSEEYVKYLAVSKYLINNVSFPGFFAKRKEQIYLNTWHGIPMKTMGFDIPGGKISSGNSAKNLLSADYLISAGKYMTDKAYMESYKLRGLYSGTILEGGFPRNDIFFHPDREKILERMVRHGVDLDPNKKIILYAPTWKGSHYSHPQTDIEEYLKLIESIERSVNTHEFQILIKPHQIVYYHIKNNGGTIKGKFIPAVLDTNEILSVTDILISDYSSIHFDFLVSGRPMVFFIPDLYAFTDYRGLYFGMDKLPGPIARTYEELEEYFAQPEKIMDGFSEKYKAERSWACPSDDGNVCARTVNALFGRKQRHIYEKGKKKLLFYAGDFRDDDITLSFLAFLNILNTDLFDITVLAQSGGSRNASDLIQELPAEIRVLYWKPFYASSETEWARHCLFWNNKNTASAYPVRFYQRELSRAFGSAEFDAVISFRTDNTVFNGMMSAMKTTKKIFWTAKGTNLSSSVLSEADLILCAAESALEQLTDYSNKCAVLALPADVRRLDKERANIIMTTIHGNRMFADSIKSDEDSAAEAVFLPTPDSQKKRFAAILCFQNKKEYEPILREFASICAQEDDCQLVLAGEGPLRENAASLAEELYLTDHVLFVGNLKNPLAYLSFCSCLIAKPDFSRLSPFCLCVKSMGIPIASCIRDYLKNENMDCGFNAETYNEQIRKKWEEHLEVLL